MYHIAIITGGSSGLGKECARALVARHIPVCVVARDKDRLQETREELAQGGQAEVLAFSADVSQPAEVTGLKKFLEDSGYEAKWLVNNAGVGFFGPLLDISDDQISQVIGGSLLGTIYTTRAFLDDLVRANGTLCNVMSTAATTSRASEAVYCAAKWGTRGFTEAIRLELKGKPIRIMAVYPGGMKTPFWKNSPGYAETSKFMDSKDVAEVIVCNLLASGCQISELLINRL